MTKKKKRNKALPVPEWSGAPVALFWDQSLVWGLICVETLRRAKVPFNLLSGQDIACGLLESHRILLVPGGWASHKIKALGEAGKSRIFDFLERGGSYLGFCGGAGLALSSPPALGLVPIERMDLSRRLPSASGEIWIQGLADHPVWKDIPRLIPVCVWWPSQFSEKGLSCAATLATYTASGNDFRVADLPVADIEALSVPLEEWEKVYGINLNPEKMLGHPAILEVPLGKGRLILSYPHLETPGSDWGNRLFINILAYLDSKSAPFFPKAQPPHSLPAPPHAHDLHAQADSLEQDKAGSKSPLPPFNQRGDNPDHPPSEDGVSEDEKTPSPLSRGKTAPPFSKGGSGGIFDELPLHEPPGPKALDCFIRINERVDELIGLGERHLLWKRRTPWLLDWRRGIRGLEYGTLAVAIKAILEEARPLCGPEESEDPWLEPARELEANVEAFCSLATRLLLEEKLAIQGGNLTKLGKVNETVDRLRAQLFGSNMNHSGLCRTIFDQLDRLLLSLLRQSGATFSP